MVDPRVVLSRVVGCLASYNAFFNRICLMHVFVDFAARMVLERKVNCLDLKCTRLSSKKQVYAKLFINRYLIPA